METNKILKTDKEFRDLIAPLSDDELQGLTNSILASGCREMLKAWKNTIIDGHNRYAICQKYNIPYSVQQMRFASKKDAKLWIVTNQLGRRNISEITRMKLVLQKETLLRQKAKKNRSRNTVEPVHTRKIMAKEIGVSERKLYWFMKIQELGTPELMRRLEAGEVKMGAAYREVAGVAAGMDTGAGYEVIARTVEVFCGGGDVDFCAPHCREAVLRNATKVEKVLGFACYGVGLMDGGGDMAGMRRRVGGLCGVAFGLVGVV
ncbi:MAG: hypothetical protein FWC92_05050 [Defluviitaleaceae bacterium]|nr:hypothetical protein [Defluviitaleaceae bacterium]